MFRGILPIGSVVKLTDIEVKVMIIGYMPVSADDSEDVHEYSGIVYPLGYQNDDQIIQFDSSSISGIEYIGLQDREQMTFEENLISMIEEEATESEGDSINNELNEEDM